MPAQSLQIAALQQRERDGKSGRDLPCMEPFRVLKIRDLAIGGCHPVSLPDSGRNRAWFIHETNDAINRERPEHVNRHWLNLAEPIAHRKVAVQQDWRRTGLLPQGMEPANEESLVAIDIGDELSCRSNGLCALAADNLAGRDMQTTSELRDLSTARSLADPVHPADKDDRHRAAFNKERTFAFSASDK